MKPFDLERALAGEPVVTVDGREVTQLHLFDAKDDITLYGVVDGHVHNWTAKGTYYSVSISDLDLRMASVKREAWVNVYWDVEGYAVVGETYPSEREAKEGVMGMPDWVKTVKIHEWEE